MVSPAFVWRESADPQAPFQGNLRVRIGARLSPDGLFKSQIMELHRKLAIVAIDSEFQRADRVRKREGKPQL